METLDRGDIPDLGELTLHNGTIYRWNRPVYAVAHDKPHVRVENRVLPAGPTVADTLANGAFYYGLTRALVEEERPVWSRMSFSVAEDNLHTAARHGIEAQLYWPGVGEVTVPELVLRRLAAAGAPGTGALPAWTRPGGSRCSASSSSGASPGAMARSGRRRCSTTSTPPSIRAATRRCAG